jgi:uncharacterized membrane protein
MSTAPTDRRAEPPAFRPEGRPHELARVLRRKRRLRAGTVQLLGAAAAVGLAFLAPQVHIGFDIPTTRAIEMLIAVGAGTVTFIGIVFSLLFLVVQFASTTFTPRLNLFRDDPIVWRAFAFYTAVVVYSLTAALVIGRDEKTSAVVPIIAFVAVLAVIIVYRRLQMGAFTSIQLASVLAQIARRGREVIDGLYVPHASVSDPIDGPGRPSAGFAHDELLQEIRWPRPPAVLQVIDVPGVLRAAERVRAVIDFKVGSGQMIAEGAVVALVSGPAQPELERQILRALTVGEDRTFEQDPAFALRLLADIGLRALSPAVNDPATAVQALDAMDGLLRVLATRDLSVDQVAGSDHTIRVRLVLPTWEDYVAVALDEIIALRASSANVSRRILRLLDELAVITPPSRRSALEARHRQVHDPGRKPDPPTTEHPQST